jgi:hypothetical protein
LSNYGPFLIEIFSKKAMNFSSVWMIIFAILGILPSRGQTSSSKGPRMCRTTNQPTHGVSNYIYHNKEVVQYRHMNKPLTTCDCVLLQTLLEEWSHTSKAYFEVLEERQIKVHHCLQNVMNTLEKNTSKAFWLASKSFEDKVKRDLFMEAYVKEIGLDLCIHKDTKRGVRFIKHELAKVIRHESLAMFAPSNI